MADEQPIDLRARALEVVEAEMYLVLGTVSPAGESWTCPVWFAHDGLDRFFWLSRPYRAHSVNLTARSRVSFVIFNSRQPTGVGLAVYASADARVVPDDELDNALSIVSPRSVAHGGRAWDRERLEPLPLELYEADPVELWLNPGEGTDIRERVPSA